MNVRGVVVDGSGTPVEGAVVSSDCARKVVRTGEAGTFRFKMKCEDFEIKLRVFGGVAAPVVVPYKRNDGFLEIEVERELDEDKMD